MLHAWYAWIWTFLFPSLLAAQQFGGHPVYQKWHQINTDTVRVIFQPGMEKKAREVSAFSHQLAQLQVNTLGNRVAKVNIVLQNQTIFSNAYVGLGPYRSEFFTTPLQNSFELGSLPWHYSLTLHEYRHIHQYNNFRKGLSKLVYRVLGEEGLELANNAAIPDWFWEGDAVYHETALSRQGRGRLPYFFNDFFSLWASEKKYSWMKIRNGSLKDFVPNHYRLGYMLTAYGYERFGSEFWKKVTDDAARFRGIFYPFQSAVRRYSGMRFQDFRQSALKYFKEQIPTMNADTFSILGRQAHFVADEEYPQWIDTSRLIFVRSSYKKVPAYVIRNVETGENKKVRLKDFSVDNYFSYRSGKVVYSSVEPDLRWRWRDYNVIRVLDIHNNVQRRLRSRTRYFAPDISIDGSRIVAVCVNADATSDLHVLDASTGNLLHKIPNRDSLFYTYPKFYRDKLVSAVRNQRGEMSLATIDLQGNIQYLTPFSMNVIGFPTVTGDTILFTASQNKDRLFAAVGSDLFEFSPGDSLLPPTGLYHLSTHHGNYAFTGFSASGIRLMHGPLSDLLWKKVDPKIFLDNLSERGIDSVNKSNPVSPEIEVNRMIENYSPLFRPFNFHSLIPYISDPDYTFSLISENILNTLTTELYFNYNRNENFKQAGVAFVYGGLFPQLRLGFDYTLDRNAFFSNRSRLIYWNETEFFGGVSLPLNLSRGTYFNTLNVAGDYVLNNRRFTGAYKDSFDNSSFSYLQHSFSFSRRLLQARQHIYPRFAQTLSANYRHTVSENKANQFMTVARLYWPGLSTNHSFVLHGAFHQRDTLRNIRFSNNFPFSRGYASENFHRMLKWGADYHSPIAYPDWGFANLVYFLRIRASLFFDWTHVRDYDQGNLFSADFRSYGTEIYFDTKWWNQQEVSFGFRYSKLQGPDHAFEFILPVNLLNR